jgi:hypothetical protein
MAISRGPALDEGYLDNLRRVVEDGGTFVKVDARDIQDSIDVVSALNPSLFMVPTAGKAGKLYSLVPGGGSGDFTVSRNGTATYFDKDGLLKTAAANEPRFEFDPLTGEYKGVLVEPAATNLVLRSEEFNLSPWVRNSSFEINSNVDFLAPDSTQTANSIIVASGDQRINQDINLGEGIYTFSVWFYVAESASVRIRAFVDEVANNTTLNLIPGVWQRITQTYTVLSSITQVGIRTTSNLIGKELIFWGAQLEVGSVATSYIPTTGSQVTRPADLIIKQQIPQYIPQTEGTIYCEIYVTKDAVQPLGNRTFFTIHNDSNSQVIRMSATLIGFALRVTLTSTASKNINVPLQGKVKIAVRYKDNDYAVSINGNQPVVYGDLVVPNNLRSCHIGRRRDDTEIYNDTISTVAILAQPLSNEQLQLLTQL